MYMDKKIKDKNINSIVTVVVVNVLFIIKYRDSSRRFVSQYISNVKRLNINIYMYIKHLMRDDLTKAKAKG